MAQVSRSISAVLLSTLDLFHYMLKEGLFGIERDEVLRKLLILGEFT